MAKYPQVVVDNKIADLTAAYERGEIGEDDYYIHVYPWAAGLFTRKPVFDPDGAYDSEEDEEIEALLDRT